MTQQLFERMSQFYASGEPLPWDDTLPPPELRTLLKEAPVGRALDLGCGYGRASIYMTQLGWDVDGVDFIADAVAEAQRRAALAHVAPRLHCASITDLSFLTGPYDLAVDVGCAHALEIAELTQHVGELARLLRSGADYLLYARLADSAETARPDDQTASPGLDEQTLLDLLNPHFNLITKTYGERTEFHAPWKSAWFHYRRR